MEIIFLGTGPSGGIQAQGKSARFESSVLVQSPTTNLLIDVTKDFPKQAKLIKSMDALLITHAHQDAIGGINQLQAWQKKRGINKLPLFSLGETIQKIKHHFQNTDYLKFNTIKAGHPFRIGRVTITPFLVKHSIQAGFPTLGFHLSENGHRLVYVSDMASWDEEAENLMEDADSLVIDGAMWGKRMVAHLDIKRILPKICGWSAKKIIFTQIGKTCPKHEILQKEIQKICSRALPAYDGMKLKLQ